MKLLKMDSDLGRHQEGLRMDQGLVGRDLGDQEVLEGMEVREDRHMVREGDTTKGLRGHHLQLYLQGHTQLREGLGLDSWLLIHVH
jgi:hypothetical protein